MGDNLEYQDVNASVINSWITEGWEWGIPISHEMYERAKNGEWDVLLTPTKPVPHEWLGELCDKKILGLACGGGQQIPIFCALGAECTILDYSDLQLKSEKIVAKREGYTVNIVKADMTKPLPFDNDSFDIIFHPVSNDYVEKVEPIFRECYRILKKNGILLAGLGTGFNYVVDETEEKIVYALPFNPLKNKEHEQFILKENCGYQFSHTVGEQIGSQLRAGFILTDIQDDTNGSGRLHEFNIPTYIMTRAIKK